MSNTVGVLSATDRKQLCKITEGRFEILNEQLNSRKNQIMQEIREQVLADHQNEIEAVRAELLALQKKKEEAEEAHQRVLKGIDYEKQGIVNKASDSGLKVTYSRYDNSGNFTVEPKNIDKSVRVRTDEVLGEFNSAGHNLRTMKLNILENISVAGLESEEAKDFLGEIPKIDDLLPAPEDIKALKA